MCYYGSAVTLNTLRTIGGTGGLNGVVMMNASNTTRTVSDMGTNRLSTAITRSSTKVNTISLGAVIRAMGTNGTVSIGTAPRAVPISSCVIAGSDWGNIFRPFVEWAGSLAPGLERRQFFNTIRLCGKVLGRILV